EGGEDSRETLRRRMAWCQDSELAPPLQPPQPMPSLLTPGRAVPRRPAPLLAAVLLLSACFGSPEPPATPPPRAEPPTGPAPPAEEPAPAPRPIPRAPEPRPAPAPDALETVGPPLTGGPLEVRGDALLPHRRIVAFYGNPASENMGILGALPPEQMLARLDR